MSKYLLDKFLYTVDRDPELVERYRDDPAGTLDWWEQRGSQYRAQLHGLGRSRPGSRSTRMSAGRYASTTTWRCSSSAPTRS